MKYFLMNKVRVRNIILLLSFLYFFISACNGRHDQTSHSGEISYSKDTMLVNKLLLKLSAHAFDNIDTTLKYINLAESLSLKNNYEAGYANTLFQRGNFLYEKNEYAKALNCYSKALEQAVKADSILLRAKCLERMASVHLATGDANWALKLYYESLPLFEKVNDKRGIAKVYNIVGIYKTDTRVYDTAEYYFRRAIELNTQIGDKYAIIENKGNLGSLYEHTNRIDEAEKLYKLLAAELEAMKDKLSLPVIYYNLFSLYQNMDKETEAMTYLEKGMAISEETHDTAMLADMYSDAGEVILNQGKIKDARVLFQKSIQCSRAINEARTRIHVLEMLAKTDSASGDFRSAFRNISQIPALKDTINRRRIKNNLKASELQYENEKMQHNIDLQKAESEEQLRIKRNTIILLVLLIIIAAMASLLLYLNRRNLRKKLKIKEQELRLEALENEKKQDQLEISRLIIINNENEKRLAENQLLNLSLSVKQKSELLEDISKKLKIKMDEDNESASALQQIISQIGSHKAGNNENNLFNEKFSTIHPDFFKNLKEKHPSLTKTELNFCAFLKINLSSKQIATLLNVGPEAIRKTRYRIRKKMDMPAEDSLEDHISKF